MLAFSIILFKYNSRLLMSIFETGAGSSGRIYFFDVSERTEIDFINEVFMILNESSCRGGGDFPVGGGVVLSAKTFCFRENA